METKDILTAEQMRTFDDKRLFELEKDMRLKLIKLSMDNQSERRKKAVSKKRQCRKTIARILTVGTELKRGKTK